MQGVKKSTPTTITLTTCHPIADKARALVLKCMSFHLDPFQFQLQVAIKDHMISGITLLPANVGRDVVSHHIKLRDVLEEYCQRALGA